MSNRVKSRHGVAFTAKTTNRAQQFDESYAPEGIELQGGSEDGLWVSASSSRGPWSDIDKGVRVAVKLDLDTAEALANEILAVVEKNRKKSFTYTVDALGEGEACRLIGLGLGQRVK